MIYELNKSFKILLQRLWVFMDEKKQYIRNFSITSNIPYDQNNGRNFG